MDVQVLGVSGSPIKNSNTDRLIKAVLDASGLETEFVKLSAINVRPCMACLGCKSDNICKGQDDFPALAEKVRSAGAIVVGGYASYGSLDAFVKAFLERLFSLRHRNGLNRGKPAVVVTTGIGRGAPGLEQANDQITHTLTVEGMQVIGRLKATGNPECLVCGYGEKCAMSALPWVFGKDTKVTPEKFTRVEDQTDVWQEARRLGGEINRMLKQRPAA